MLPRLRFLSPGRRWLEKLKALWAHITDSLWFLPGILTLAGGVLAVVIVRFNDDILDAIGAEPDEIWWLFGAGSEGGRAVLDAISGSLIQVTGVVFSVTIIALQLASSQFTPRVLRTFTSDRGNQLVLGVFIGTFTYALLVQRAIRSSGDDSDGFVPALAITVAVALMLISIGFLIYFIDHASRSIQASVIMDNVTKDTRAVGERIFEREEKARKRSEFGEEHPEVVEGRSRGPDDGPHRPVGNASAGYIQAIDEDRIFLHADTQDLFIRIEQGIGDFVLPGEPLATVWPADGLSDETAEDIRKAFVLGLERTPHQDFEYGLIELVDMAVKALSPSINDPTTAMMAVDRLSELIVVMGRQPPLACERSNRTGRLCMLVRRPSFNRAITLTFDQIRHHGCTDPALMNKLVDRLGDIGTLVKPQHHDRLVQAIETARAQAATAIDDPVDRRRVLEAADGALSRIRESATARG
jgi:uncharacterized membrane protein